MTAADDADNDGTQTSTITIAVDDAASNDAFDALADQTVTVTTQDDDIPPATIDSVIFFHDDAAAEQGFSVDNNGQRSMVSQIEVVFDGELTLPTGPVSDGSFVVTNLDSGAAVGVSIASSTISGGKTTVILTFTSGIEASGSLADGNYELSIDGAPLGADADGSGSAGGVQTTGFFRFFGDSDGDRDVDGRDASNIRRAAFGVNPAYIGVFDYDNDGEVFSGSGWDMDDITAFFANWGGRLDPA